MHYIRNAGYSIKSHRYISSCAPRQRKAALTTCLNALASAQHVKRVRPQVAVRYRQPTTHCEPHFPVYTTAHICLTSFRALYKSSRGRLAVTHTHHAAHRSPPRTPTPIHHPAAAGRSTATRTTADRFRQHRQQPSHAELRRDLWGSGELLRDRGIPSPPTAFAKSRITRSVASLRHQSTSDKRTPQERKTKTPILTPSPLTGHRPPNTPTDRLALKPLHDLPHPAVDQHPGVQAAPLRSAPALLGL